MNNKYRCEDCDWQGPSDEMAPIKHLEQRITPGELMAVGQCPKCGALISVPDEDIPGYTIDAVIDAALKRGLADDLIKKAMAYKEAEGGTSHCGAAKPEAKTLVSFLETNGADASGLDDMVYDALDTAGPGINNGGLCKQVEFLLSQGLSAGQIAHGCNLGTKWERYQEAQESTPPQIQMGFGLKQ